jgi:hypothetical protein
MRSQGPKTPDQPAGSILYAVVTPRRAFGMASLRPNGRASRFIAMWSQPMLFDLAYLAGALAFFALGALAVRACERL